MNEKSAGQRERLTGTRKTTIGSQQHSARCRHCPGPIRSTLSIAPSFGTTCRRHAHLKAAAA
jgi:hypothetical protein